MRAALFLVLVFLFLQSVHAQQVEMDFHEESMAQALTRIDEQFPHVQIHYVYNELESFRVTAQVRTKRALDAVKEVVGFYPLKITQYRNHIFVEYSQRKKQQVSGRLVDENNQGVPYATVSLYDVKDSTFLTAGVSNENGCFVIPVDVQELHLRATSLGFYPQENDYKAGEIGDVPMKSQPYELQEVSIAKPMPVMERQGNTLILQVNGTALSLVGTAYDVLEYVPGLLGLDRLPNTRIYIDGVAIESLSELTQLDAAQILRISYDSSSGASQSSRNTGGMVNIYTLNSQQQGWALRAYLRASQGKYMQQNEQVNLDGHFRKLDVMAMAQFFDQSYGHEIRDNQTDQKYYYVQRGIDLSLGMNYALTPTQSLGAQYKLLNHLKTVKTYAPILWRVYDSNEMDEFIRLEGSSITLDYQPRHSANVYYQGQFGTAWKLRADGEYFSDGQTLLQDLDLGVPNTPRRQNDISNTLYATRLDAEHFRGSSNINLGISYSDTQRRNSNTHNQDATESSRRKEQLLGAYIVWNRERQHWKTQMGLRFEQSHVNASVNQQYNWFFPHASVSYRNHRQELTLGYATHSQRPTYSQLNDYSFYNLSLLYQSGNPNLKASYLHRLSLLWKQGTLSFSANYQHVSQYIMQYVEKTSNGVAMNYKNLNRVNLYQLQATYAPRFGAWTPQWNAILSGQDMEDYRKPVLSLEWLNQIQLGKSLLLTANAHFQTAGHSNAVYYKPKGCLDVSVVKSLRHWTIQLHVDDVLRTSRQHAFYSGGANYSRWSYQDNRRIGLSLSYKLRPESTASQYKGKQAAASEKERF